MKTVSFLGMISLTTSVFASQVLTLDESKRLEATISKDSMNRLAVAHDRITQIFGDAETYVFQTDDNTGQIFIKPSEINGTKPLSLTVITEKGQTQDITLRPGERGASTIILKAASSSLSPSSSSLPSLLPEVNPMMGLERSLSFQDQVIEVLKHISSGQLVSIEGEEVERAVREGFDIRYQERYQVGPFKGFTFEVTNRTETPIEIQEKTFYQTGDVALSFKKRVLQPQESTQLTVIQR